MINHYTKRGPWIWRCHIDLTKPNSELWNYLTPTIEKYDAVVLSLEEYRQKLETPQLFFLPAIDPFTHKNRELSEKEIKERLNHYIPTDLPLGGAGIPFPIAGRTQRVMQAFKLARKKWFAPGAWAMLYR
jgi:trehalose synthase